MNNIWEMEEFEEYFQLFQTWRQAMLDAGYKSNEFSITITKKG